MTELTKRAQDLKALYEVIRDYVEGFELATSAGPYTPSPFGQRIMFGCIIELIDTPAFIRAFEAAKLRLPVGTPCTI